MCLNGECCGLLCNYCGCLRRLGLCGVMLVGLVEFCVWCIGLLAWVFGFWLVVLMWLRWCFDAVVNSVVAFGIMFACVYMCLVCYLVAGFGFILLI